MPARRGAALDLATGPLVRLPSNGLQSMQACVARAARQARSERRLPHPASSRPLPQRRPRGSGPLGSGSWQRSGAARPAGCRRSRSAARRGQTAGSGGGKAEAGAQVATQAQPLAGISDTCSPSPPCVPAAVPSASGAGPRPLLTSTSTSWPTRLLPKGWARPPAVAAAAAAVASSSNEAVGAVLCRCRPPTAPPAPRRRRRLPIAVVGPTTAAAQLSVPEPSTVAALSKVTWRRTAADTAGGDGTTAGTGPRLEAKLGSLLLRRSPPAGMGTPAGARATPAAATAAAAAAAATADAAEVGDTPFLAAETAAAVTAGACWEFLPGDNQPRADCLVGAGAAVRRTAATR